MFKYYALKKYGLKFLPTLERNFGFKRHYSASEVRTIVYKHGFNPKYLPLAYLLYLEHNMLNSVLYIEFPELDIEHYKQEIIDYLHKKEFVGCLAKLL